MLMTSFLAVLGGSLDPVAAAATRNFTLGSMPFGASLTRTDFGLQYDDSGNVVWGPHNILSYSEEFDNVVWEKLLLEGGAPTAGPTTGLPPGASESWMIRDDGVTPSGRYGLRHSQMLIPPWPLHCRYHAMHGPTDQAGSDRSSFREWYNAANRKPSWVVDPPFSVGATGLADNVQALTVGDWCGCDFELLDPNGDGTFRFGIYIYDYANHAAVGDDNYVTAASVSYVPSYRYDYHKASANAAFGARWNNNGLLIEKAATQHLANSRSLSDWTDTSSIITASTGVFNQDQSDGSRLTASAPGQKIERAETISSTELTFACWVKGVTINNEVWFSPDGGTTQISMTPYLLSGNWEVFEYTWTGANPNLEIEIVDSGDVLDVDMLTLAEEPWAQMPIASVGVASQRPADVLTISGLATSTTFDVELTSTRMDGTDSYIEASQVSSNGSGEYVFDWADFPASDIREHRIVALLEFDEV